LAIQIDRLTLLLFGKGSDSHAWHLGSVTCTYLQAMTAGPLARRLGLAEEGRVSGSPLPSAPMAND
jgi:hypothetical protein